MKNLLEFLNINESILFYKLVDSNLTPETINTIFEYFISEKKGTKIQISVRKAETNSTKPVFYSLCVFSFEAPPSFLLAKSKMNEVHIAYLLLVEFDGYLGVSKKYISDFDKTIKQHAIPVSSEIIMNYRLDDKALIEKLNMKNAMSSNEKIREKVVYARNIGAIYSPINSEKNVVNQMTIRANDGVVSVSGKSSRVNFQGSKSEYLEYFNRIITEVRRIKRYKKTPNYLDNFAEAINFEKEIKVASPIAAMIPAYEIYDYTLEHRIISKKKKNGDSFNLDNITGILNFSFFATKISDTKYKLSSTLPADHELRKTPEIDIIDSFSIKILQTKLKLESIKLDEYYIEFEEIGEISLLSYLNNNKLLNVTFAPLGLMYDDGQLFKERDFVQRAQLALDILRPQKSLESTKCEKFPDNKKPKTATEFDSKSLFTWIEKKFEPDIDRYLVCDDLGNEWADYIYLKRHETVKFLHAKSAEDLSLSASNFHEVIGQALKNIGNMRGGNEVEQKGETWKSLYSKSIERFRFKPTGSINALDEFVLFFKEASISSTVKYEAWLVVNFLSKQELEEELEKAKKGQPIKSYAAQLISLLIGFISGCQEAHVQPFVACLE